MNMNILEANRGVLRGLQQKHIHRLNESVKRSYGVDLTNKALFPFDGASLKEGKLAGFSWKEYREAAYRVAAKKMMEANAEGAFGQLLRAGVSNVANEWYQLVETQHEKIGETTTSNKLIEAYAPLHRGAVPRRVQRGQKFPETKVQGLDVQIENEKFGALATFERELFDDDQTGQIGRRAMDIGENMKILEDAWFFQRFLGTAGSFAGDVIPASQTYNGGVFSTALTGGGSNRLASYAAFSSANVQALDLLLMQQLDLNGNKMLVNPNTLLVGTSLKFAGAALLNSEWYPSSTGHKVGGTGTDTGIGGVNAKNVLQGLYSLVVSRFYPNKAYSLGEGGKGIVMQRREALEVIQENPASGMAFEQDEFRMKSRARWEPDWIDPRFWAQGNDGSV